MVRSENPSSKAPSLQMYSMTYYMPPTCKLGETLVCGIQHPSGISWQHDDVDCAQVTVPSGMIEHLQECVTQKRGV